MNDLYGQNKLQGAEHEFDPATQPTDVILGRARRHAINRK